MSNDRLFLILMRVEFLGIDCKLGWLCVLVLFGIVLKFGGIWRRALVIWFSSDCIWKNDALLYFLLSELSSR